MMTEERDATIQSLVGNDAGEFNYARQLLIDRWPYVERWLAGQPFAPFEVEIQASSSCNLYCRWCVGHAIQRQHKVLHLPNNITRDNIHQVVDGILACRYDGLGIDTVKFSGFIGEPLLVWDTIEPAVQRLVGAGLRVGIFTNGILMNEPKWTTLVNVAYVHVSLDAGPNTFGPLRGMGRKDTRGYDTVISNIAGLHEKRKANYKVLSGPRINIGYVVVPWNTCEIEVATHAVKAAGADSIRFKVDVTGEHDLTDSDKMDEAFSAMRRMADFYADDEFNVHIIHDRQAVEGHEYTTWQSAQGCFFQHFCASVGSDGNLYLCDFNTMPGAVPLGNVINQPFKDVWDSARRQYLADGACHICLSSVCPPFGNAANMLLEKLKAQGEPP